MAPKAKTSPRAPAPMPARTAQPGSPGSAPLTLEERLHRIEAMGQRIDGYIHFICKISSMAGTSNEVKERGVAAFYEQLVIVERQLGKVHDELRLE